MLCLGYYFFFFPFLVAQWASRFNKEKNWREEKQPTTKPTLGWHSIWCVGLFWHVIHFAAVWWYYNDTMRYTIQVPHPAALDTSVGAWSRMLHIIQSKFINARSRSGIYFQWASFIKQDINGVIQQSFLWVFTQNIWNSWKSCKFGKTFIFYSCFRVCAN